MSNSIPSVYGLNIAALFQSVIGSIETRGSDLYAKIDNLTKPVEGSTEGDVTTSAISQEQMLVIQFEIGQYNAMVEMLSSVSKSLTDMMKTLAQRSS